MGLDTTISVFEKNIEKVDKKLDKENKIDEKKVIDKVKRIAKLFSDFEKNKLKELKTKLSPDKYKELEIEFNNLKQFFERDIDSVNKLLENIDDIRFSTYEKIIDGLLNKFYGVDSISSKDKVKNTLWAMLVIYAGLDKDPAKQKYISNWKNIIKWIQEYERINPNTLQEGDIILFPREVSLFKNLNNYKNLIDLKELFLNNKLIFKKELTKEEKGLLYPILINFFNYRGNSEKVKELFSELMKIGKKVNLPEENVKVNGIIKSKQFGKNFESLQTNDSFKNVFKKVLKEYEANPDWHWWEYPKEFGKGVMYGFISSFMEVANLFSNPGEIIEGIKSLLNDFSDFFDIIYDELKDVFKNIDFGDPYGIGKIIGKILANVIMTMVGVGVAGKTAILVSKVGTKIKGLEKICNIASKGLRRGADFIHSALGGYRIDNLSKFFREDIYKLTKLPSHLQESLQLLKNKEYAKLWNKNYVLTEIIYASGHGGLILDYIKFKKVLPQSEKGLEFVVKEGIGEKRGNYIKIDKVKLAGFIARKEKTQYTENVSDFIEFLKVIFEGLFSIA